MGTASSRLGKFTDSVVLYPNADGSVDSTATHRPVSKSFCSVVNSDVFRYGATVSPFCGSPRGAPQLERPSTIPATTAINATTPAASTIGFFILIPPNISLRAPTRA